MWFGTIVRELLYDSYLTVMLPAWKQYTFDDILHGQVFSLSYDGLTDYIGTCSHIHDWG